MNGTFTIVRDLENLDWVTADGAGGGGEVGDDGTGIVRQQDVIIFNCAATACANGRKWVVPLEPQRKAAAGLESQGLRGIDANARIKVMQSPRNADIVVIREGVRCPLFEYVAS